MTPKKIPEITQMTMLFAERKLLLLPEDKQRELAIALADLLLNAVAEPVETEKEKRA